MKKNIAAENDARKIGIPKVSEIVAAQQMAPTIGPTKNRFGGREKLRIADGTIADARQISKIVHSGKSPSLVVAISMPRRIAETSMEIILLFTFGFVFGRYCKRKVQRFVDQLARRFAVPIIVAVHLFEVEPVDVPWLARLASNIVLICLARCLFSRSSFALSVDSKSMIRF